MGFVSAKLFLLLPLLVGLTLNFCTAQNFTCRSLVGYVTANNTEPSAIQSLFDVRNLESLLGDNNFQPTRSNPGDGLWHIAAEVFSGLVVYQQIQLANDIQNAR